MDQFFWDANEELKDMIGREPTYEEIMEFMDFKSGNILECPSKKVITKTIEIGKKKMRNVCIFLGFIAAVFVMLFPQYTEDKDSNFRHKERFLVFHKEIYCHKQGVYGDPEYSIFKNITLEKDYKSYNSCGYPISYRFQINLSQCLFDLMLVSIITAGSVWLVSLSRKPGKLGTKEKILANYRTYQEFKEKFDGFSELSEAAKKEVRRLFEVGI